MKLNMLQSAETMFLACMFQNSISENKHFPFSGTPAMTTRGCLENDFETIADYLLRAAQIASAIQREHGKSQRTFLKGLQSDNKEIWELRIRVEAFASQFSMPGFDI